MTLLLAFLLCAFPALGLLIFRWAHRIGYRAGRVRGRHDAADDLRAESVRLREIGVAEKANGFARAAHYIERGGR